MVKEIKQIWTPGIISMGKNNGDKFMSSGYAKLPEFSQTNNLKYIRDDLDEAQAVKLLKDNQNELRKILSELALRQYGQGADFINLVPNVLNIFANEIKYDTGVPVLHVATPTVEIMKKEGPFQTAVLIATERIMTSESYLSVFHENGKNVFVPSEPNRKIINSIIFDEIKPGKVKPESRNRLIEILAWAKLAGADVAAIGCGDLADLLQADHTVSYGKDQRKDELIRLNNNGDGTLQDSYKNSIHRIDIGIEHAYAMLRNCFKKEKLL